MRTAKFLHVILNVCAVSGGTGICLLGKKGVACCWRKGMLVGDGSEA
jgi:hypothetical protein